MAPSDDLIALCRTRLSDDDVARLVGWVAWRLGRSQALAGNGPPIARLEHVVLHWLDDRRRADLSEWLERRLAQGLPPVPG